MDLIQVKEKIIKNIKETIPYLIVILVIILIRIFIITPVSVDGPSMENTLKNGDFLVLNKIDKNYERFDIIVFKLSNEKLIKRIIGLPGEKIEIKDNKLYINDKYVEEDYTKKMNEEDGAINMEATTVPDGYYFVMGDNRVESFDSRYFGPISKNLILGTVNLRLYPFNKIGNINK